MRDKGLVFACVTAALACSGCGKDPLSPIDAGRNTGPQGFTINGASEPDPQGPANLGGSQDGDDAPGTDQPNAAPSDDGNEGEPAQPDDATSNEPNACTAVEDVAGSCPGYGYDCSTHSDTETWCLYDVLGTLPDPCTLFEDGSLCAGSTVSPLGIASCQLQECFGLTTFDACYGNLTVLCDFAY